MGPWLTMEMKKAGRNSKSFPLPLAVYGSLVNVTSNTPAGLITEGLFNIPWWGLRKISAARFF
jgi:hypothetical protein